LTSSLRSTCRKSEIPSIRPIESWEHASTFEASLRRFELEEDAILIRAQEEFQIEQMEDILRDKLVRRKVDTGCLEPGGIEGSGSEKRQTIPDRAGHSIADAGKEIVKRVKEIDAEGSGRGVQGEKIPYHRKKRDDLQQVIAMLREAKLQNTAAVREFPRLIEPEEWG
jgi:uncharacterized protein YajQ (UPF0234 family)